MSKKPHLRHEAGGDPARSVSTDLKNPTAAPQDDNDFPDSPQQPTDDKPQDKPDLDAFAKRLGTDTIDSGDGLDAIPDRDSSTTTDDSTKSRLVLAGGGGLVAAFLVLVTKRRRKRHPLAAKATALAVAAHSLRN